jgi:hypothetical protein
MRLSCNAPVSFWAEFNATAAYLTNLTSSSSLNGQTPYEFWTGCVPSLSHLREIGCCAFALIQTNNPKIYRRSRLCILIRYAPHAKAYWLWDTIDGSIFNSFHVTFLECLDEQPVDLMPGTTICIDPNAMPSWDVPAHSDAAPPVPSPHTLPSSSCNSPSKNHCILTPGGDFSNSTTDCDASSPMLLLLPCISPGENHHMLTPGSDDLDSSHTAPSLCRSTRSRTPSSRLVMDDGLLPSRRLSEAISDSTSAAARKHSSRTSKHSPLSDEISDQLLTVAFLLEFSPF